MCTLWEMAEVIRGEEAAVALRRVDVGSGERVAYWCRSFGTTPLTLWRAIQTVGDDSAAIRNFLQTRRKHRDAGTILAPRCASA